MCTAFLLQGESVGLITGLGQAASDIIVAVFQMEYQKVQSDTDYAGVEGSGAGGDAHIEEYIFISAYRVFHDGMASIQIIQEFHECFPRRPFGTGAQVDADQGVHAVVSDDSSHQLMVLAGRDGGHENYGIIGVMGILAAEEIDAFLFDIGFEGVSFQILFMIALRGEWSDIVSHETTFLRYTRNYLLFAWK